MLVQTLTIFKVQLGSYEVKTTNAELKDMGVSQISCESMDMYMSCRLMT